MSRTCRTPISPIQATCSSGSRPMASSVMVGFRGGGADRLLRSIVVLPDRRGHGLGQALVATLEQQARHLRVQRLHLLTTTAAPFFRTLGYADTDRGAAPPAIAASREFAALCPASAAYLVKAL